MLKTQLTILLVLATSLAFIGCAASAATPQKNVSLAPSAASGENISEITTPIPLTETPTATTFFFGDPSTATSAAQTLASQTLTSTLDVTGTLVLSPTITPTPTAPPVLPLRTDLPPMTLQDFPRPPNDNGLGIHFIAGGYYDAAELDKQIARMQALHLKWATVVYTDENHLEIAAQKFSAAGIYVVWRKTLKPYQRYSSWQRDIDIIKKYNLPPYMQVYNEAELEIEWDDHPQNRDEYILNVLSAAKDVYNAGGYPGIQFLDEDWLREFINQVYARKGDALFHRMFFIPHAYGVNHPPDYQQDETGVLGFRTYATIFFKRLGFVPPFIVGEGGWKVDSDEDNRFPKVTEELHRDYTMGVYNWFRTGTLSNGAKLPDYLFAFNMWMLAGGDEAGAWYDSFNGNRTLTINAVSSAPLFVRKFSWDK